MNRIVRRSAELTRHAESSSQLWVDSQSFRERLKLSAVTVEKPSLAMHDDARQDADVGRKHGKSRCHILDCLEAAFPPFPGTVPKRGKADMTTRKFGHLRLLFPWPELYLGQGKFVLLHSY